MTNPLAAPTPPTELTVVGEHKTDPDQLLLLGTDGHYYAYSLPDDRTTPVEPDDSTWSIEASSSHDLVS
jgi:hypothetical protein